MATEVKTKSQDVVKCHLCQEPVSFFCRRCGVNLCDPCVPVHLRLKTKFGHDIVEFSCKDDDDSCLCDSHPKHECAAYCDTCDLPICMLCVSVKHKSHKICELHDKLEDLQKDIVSKNIRLQSFRQNVKTLLNHTTNILSSLSSFYQGSKDEITDRGKIWKNLIDNHVKRLHQKLEDSKTENKGILLKQKKDFEEMILQIDEINRKAMQIQKSKNAMEVQKVKHLLDQKRTMTEFMQLTFPTFHKCKIDDKYIQTYFGYIERMPNIKMSLLEKNFIPGTDSSTRLLDVPSVSSVIDTGFPARHENHNRLYDMTVTDDKKVWVVGETNELKLFDLQGKLCRTVLIADIGVHICIYNKQVIFSDEDNKAIKTFNNYGKVVTLFRTKDWKPSGITSTASGDILVCLCTKHQSKVVRYSNTGTVLQEIQYDSHLKPLYSNAWHIDENVNGDIIVADLYMVVAVNRLGIHKYTYRVGYYSFGIGSNATDINGNVFVADRDGDMIHMLDIDGRFLRYIIPREGLQKPRAICMIGVGEMIVAEEQTGLVKRIKFM